MKTQIIAEDNDILVCYKPAGFPVETVHSTKADMVSELKKYLKEKTGQAYLGVIHRLDQPVSGYMVFAKTGEAAKNLSRQVTAGGEMHKEYEAVCFGSLSVKEGRLEDYLITDKINNITRVADSKTPTAKKAELEYKVIACDEATVTLRIKLISGRHHQIRVQFANMGCPILGDRKYGTEQSKEYSLKNGIGNLKLSACCLTFRHPVTGKMMKFDSADMKDERL